MQVRPSPVIFAVGVLFEQDVDGGLVPEFGE